MENQTNYPPVQPVQSAGNSSGANTVLLVFIILIIAGFGYWWFTRNNNPSGVNGTPTINVDVKLPTDTSSTGTTGTTTAAPDATAQ